MRDPITKLSIVTKETCDSGIYKVLSQSQSISDAHQDPIDNHIKINIVYFAGKVVRKTKGMMNSSETSVLVLGDQAVYLYQSSNGQLKRTIPIKEINKILVYPQSQLLFSTSQKEYDLLVQFESPAKDKQAPEIDFVINVLQVCCDVLFNNKKPVIEKRQTNPLDDKEGNNLKKPEVHREVTIPLTSFRVPLVKSTVPIENLIRPNAPSAQSNQNAPDLQRLRDDDAAQEQLSPQARSVLKHPLFAGMKTTTPEDEDDTETETEDEQQSPRNVNRRLSADQQQQNEVGDDENQSEAAPRAFPMPMPPGGASIASSSRTITSPTGGYSPNVQPRGILKKDTPVTEQEEEISKRNEELTRRLKQVETLQRSVEQQQIQAIEMCDYIQKMTQSVREVSRTPPRSTSEEPATSTNKNSNNTDSGLNDDSSSVPNPAVGGNKSDSNNASTKNNKADEKTAATKESSQQQKGTKDGSSSVLLPSALQKVTPAPPALLPDSFVKAVFGDDHPSHQLRSNNNMMMMMSSSTTPGAASRTVTSGNGVVAASSNNTVNADGSASQGSLRSSSPNTSATLSSYYQQARSPAKSGTTSGDQQKLSVVMAPPQNEEEIEKRKNMLLQEAMAEARKQVLKEQQEAAAAKALSPQDLQDEVVRRVRAAEDMFAQRPANEKAIFRRFHIEQRQRYLTELQAAVTTGKRPAPLAYSHFKFEGQSSTPFPLAIDIFLTQQELLYLLRIAQAEQPSANVLGSGNNNSNNNPANGNYDGSSWNGASENVFAAQQNIYSAPVHQDLGGPLEPLAAHTSPEPPTVNKQQQQQQHQQQQRWEDLTPQQQEEARRYWANQQHQAPVQQPQQPAASSSAYHHRQQQPQQPVQPQQPMQPASSPQPRQPVRNVNNNASGNIRPSPGLATYKQRYR